MSCHPVKFFNNLYDLRDQFCDFTLLVENDEIKTHAIILLANSGLVQRRLSISDVSNMNIKQLTKDQVLLLLDFIYGVVSITIETPISVIIDLLEAGYYFEIPPLTTYCTDYILKKYEFSFIRDFNIIELLPYYQRIVMLPEYRITKMLQDFVSISFSETLDKSPLFFASLTEYQRSLFMYNIDDYCIKNEDNLLDLLISWLEKLPHSRRNELVKEILYYISPGLLDQNHFDTYCKYLRESGINCWKDNVTFESIQTVRESKIPRILCKDSDALCAFAIRTNYNPTMITVSNSIHFTNLDDDFEDCVVHLYKYLPNSVALMSSCFKRDYIFLYYSHDPDNQNSSVVPHGLLCMVDIPSVRIMNIPYPDPSIWKFTLTVSDNYLLAIGGRMHHNISNAIFLLDLVTMKWRKLDVKLPRLIFDFAVCDNDGIVYVSGGCYHSGKKIHETKQFFSLNIATEKITQQPKMLIPRSCHQQNSLNDVIFVYGGSSGNVGTIIDCFNIYLNEWNRVTDARNYLSNKGRVLFYTFDSWKVYFVLDKGPDKEAQIMIYDFSRYYYKGFKNVRKYSFQIPSRRCTYITHTPYRNFEHHQYSCIKEI